MRINHNIAALNTYRQLSANTVNTSRSLEKLSSGLRINRAGDDAAGLAISEKMRSQIRGLETASRNANDGISLIQTAEGALNETHSILQRMKELAVQAANDTNTETDRAEIQKEIDQLKTEITRIAEQTEFNTKKLLDGSMSIKADLDNTTNITKIAIKPEATVAEGNYTVSVEYIAATEGDPGQSAGATMSTETTTGLSNPNIVTESEYDGDYTVETAIDDDTGDVTITLKQGSETVATETVSSEEHAVGGTVTVGDITFDFEANGIQGGESDTITVTPYSPKTDASPASAVVTITNLDDPSASVEASNFDIEYAEGLVDGTYEANLTITDESMVFHIGANSGQNTKLSINNMDAASLGVDGINLETQEGADVAIKTIDDAITKVSSQRAALGAMQNRLEHTINNLGTAAENLTAAESRIRDVDMAKEMMEFTKNNILSQASQAMLAQANLQPQSVLQLLQ